MYANDFVCFQETHALEGRTIALDMPQGFCAVWANGTARQGGIGIALSQAFLMKFDTIDPSKDFEIIEGGRP